MLFLTKSPTVVQIPFSLQWCTETLLAKLFTSWSFLSLCFSSLGSQLEIVLVISLYLDHLCTILLETILLKTNGSMMPKMSLKKYGILLQLSLLQLVNGSSAKNGTNLAGLFTQVISFMICLHSVLSGLLSQTLQSFSQMELPPLYLLEKGLLIINGKLLEILTF